jgi:hypothetical protein
VPRQGVPRLALPRLPLPIACPAPGILPCGATNHSAAAFPDPSGQGKDQEGIRQERKAQHRRERDRAPRPLPAGCLPTDGYTQVIRRTTIQPVRSIKGQRAADRCSHFLDHVSHIRWQNRVAHQSSDHRSCRVVWGGGLGRRHGGGTAAADSNWPIPTGARHGSADRRVCPGSPGTRQTPAGPRQDRLIPGSTGATHRGQTRHTHLYTHRHATRAHDTNHDRRTGPADWTQPADWTGVLPSGDARHSPVR